MPFQSYNNTVDTDVLVLAISDFAKLHSQTKEFLVDFVRGKSRKFYLVHRIFNDLGEPKALVLPLPLLHSFTGCNQLSFLFHVTKNSAGNPGGRLKRLHPISALLSLNQLSQKLKRLKQYFNTSL